MFFDGFTLETIEANGQRIRLRRGGEGPPLLMLHSNPQTHAMWHKLAPSLARRFTVVCPDIRAWGFSSSPPASISSTIARAGWQDGASVARCWFYGVRKTGSASGTGRSISGAAMPTDR